MGKVARNHRRSGSRQAVGLAPSEPRLPQARALVRDVAERVLGHAIGVPGCRDEAAAYSPSQPPFGGCGWVGAAADACAARSSAVATSSRSSSKRSE